MTAQTDLDTTRCPLCAEPNQCAVAAGQDPSTCWCMTATMDPDALARIPVEAQGLVCICPSCAAGALPSD
ncbi:MAG: cysteine-rich CWC family protein [Myxococcota bacterium]